MAEGKVVVITGGASGIGRGLAQIADQRGMTVVLADIDSDGLEHTAAVLKSEPLLVRTDVTDATNVNALAEQVFARFGKVDLLFNNAGILRGGLSWEIELEQWRRVIDVNLMGVVNGLHAFVPRMIATDIPCRIVNTASVGGFISSPLIAPYTATKFAVVALTESLAIELQTRNSKVAVSLLAPGPVKSNIYSDTQTGSFAGDIVEAVDAMDAFTGAGMDAEDFARWTFEGIDAERFWLVGEREMFGPLIASRTHRILGDVNPHPQHYGEALAEEEAP